MPRIVINARAVFPGQTGIGEFARNSVLSLAETDHTNEYVILTSSDCAFKNLPGNLSTLTIINADRHWDNWKLPQLLEELKADIYFNPLFQAPCVDVCPCVITIHDVIPISHPGLTSHEFKAFFWEWACNSIDIAAKIVTVSEFSKNEIIKHMNVSEDKISVVYQAIRASDTLDYTIKKINAVRLKYRLPEDYILFVGTLDERKNIHVLLKAFDLISKSTNLSLVICGKVNNTDFLNPPEVKPYKNHLGVIFTGYVDDDDMPALYKGARVFCFPSLYEGFGIPPLEAMSVGTPAIVSSHTSLPEISGNAAIFASPIKPEEWANAITSLSNDIDLRNAQIMKGQLHAAKYNRQNHGFKLQNIFMEVLANENRN